MRTIHTIPELRTAIGEQRQLGKRIAFVPTMGNLHQGHLNLITAAVDHAECVVASIFVNPLQFGPNEDLDSYPRTLAADQQQLAAAGTQLLFAPSVAEMYPQGQALQTQVSVPDITETLCGASRPGHFTGVATVVSKLFNIVLPDVALFGEKDFQQLAVIRKMVADMCIPVEIVGVPTARSEDGLALSSRNGYLSTEERQIAPRLYQILTETRNTLADGNRDFTQLEQQAGEALISAGFRPDYVAIRDSKTLREVTTNTVSITILAAASLGNTRLIDNVTLALNPAII